MADIKKTIEVEIISNTGQVDKISGTLDDVKKKIDQISKAANGTIKFKIDGVERTNDEIQKITNNTKKAEKEAKGLTDEYKNTAKAAGDAADETEKLGKNTKKASEGAKGGGGGGGFFGGLKEGLGDLQKGTALSAGLGAAIGTGVAGAALAAADAIKDAAVAAVNFGIELEKNASQIQSVFGLAKDDAVALASQITATSQTFGTDYQETLLAVNAAQQQFGLSAKEATDLVNQGLAAGLDVNGEFLASLQEYPTYFAEAGVSADAFLAITQQQIQQGIFSDKGLDSIKEANIRLRELTPATQKALNDLQIPADAVQKALADGSKTTFDIVQEVSAKLSELGPSSQVAGQAIADIFGGAGEDAGIEFLGTLQNINNEQGSFNANLSDTAKAQLEQQQAQAELNATWASFFEGAGSGFTGIKTAFIQFATAALKGIVDIINYFIDLYNESFAVRYVVEGLKLSFKNTYDVISAGVKQIILAFKALGGIVKGVFTLDFDGIKKSYTDYLESTGKNIIQLGKDVKDNTEEAIKAIKDGSKQKIVLKTSVVDETKPGTTTKPTGGGAAGGGKASTTGATKTAEQIADEKFKKEKEKSEADLANKIAKINEDLATKLKTINEDVTLSNEERANKTKDAELNAQLEINKTTTENLENIQTKAEEILGESSKEAADLTKNISELGVKAEQLKAAISDVATKGAAQASKDALVKGEEELQNALNVIAENASKARLAIAQDATLTEKERQEALTKIASDEEDARIAAAKNAYQTLKDNAVIIGDERKKVEEKLTKSIQDENVKREKDADAARKKDVEKAQERADKIAEIAGKIADAIGQIGDAINAVYDIQIKKIEEGFEEQVKAQEKANEKRLSNQELTDAQVQELERQNAEQLATLEEEKQAKIKEIQKKQADVELAITIANIIAQTALAVAKVTGQTGVGAAFAVPIVLASGAIQVATAIAQRAAIQGLAKGGMVYGPGGPTDDMVPAMLSNGESVMTAEATRRFAPLLSILNESVGGNAIKPNFYAAGGVVTANPGQVSVSNIGDLAAVAGQSAIRAYILDSDVTSQSIRNARIVRDSRTK
jgi:hypothetical protein